MVEILCSFSSLSAVTSHLRGMKLDINECVLPRGCLSVFFLHKERRCRQAGLHTATPTPLRRQLRGASPGLTRPGFSRAPFSSPSPGNRFPGSPAPAAEGTRGQPLPAAVAAPPSPVAPYPKGKGNPEPCSVVTHGQPRSNSAPGSQDLRRGRGGVERWGAPAASRGWQRCAPPPRASSTPQPGSGRSAAPFPRWLPSKRPALAVRSVVPRLPTRFPHGQGPARHFLGLFHRTTCRRAGGGRRRLCPSTLQD